jgi:hypothetical protein
MTEHSASIFWLKFGIDTPWQLLDTSVRSPILPEVDFFARGVWDAAKDLTAAQCPLNVTMTVERVGAPLVPSFVYVQEEQQWVDTSVAT